MTGGFKQMIENYRFLAKYNKWLNEKIYTVVSELPSYERHRDYEAFFGSIHNTLNHLVLTDKIWLNRFAVQENCPAFSADILEIHGGVSSLKQILFENFEDLKRHRARMDEAIENWTLQMQPDFPLQVMRYANMSGKKREHPMWQALTHFFNHQTHHRGQITTMLSQAHVDYGVTDLIAMLDLEKK